MKPIAPQQIITIHTLLSPEVKADKELKAALIAQYTGDESKISTRDLTYNQAYELIKDLQAQKNTTPIFVRSDKMRKKIISMAHDMSWQIYDFQKKKLIADIKHINDWCEKYSYLHKPLDSYTYEELPRLVSQFEAVYTDALAK